MRKLRVSLAVVFFGALILLTTSGRFLIVNAPQRADVIVVLAGETDRRPALGLQLLEAGEAPRMLLDVPLGARIYNVDQLDIARSYVQSLPGRKMIDICPIRGLSTKGESHDVLQCLPPGARKILVVTSDFHTRRARSIFQHELKDYDVSVAAAYDSRQFGGSWWRNRQWAKVNLDEWLRLVWWEIVDRWR